ncbi:MAG TPA: hypothetical protein VM388_09925 [Acidimicrobiales bacterium]|nr:hypothetical protein [Acidimicrobiales bacterium]
MATLIKKGRKKGTDDSVGAPMPEAAAAEPTTDAQPPAETTPMPVTAERTQVEKDYGPPPTYQAAADYTPPTGAEDFQLPERHIPAEPPPSREPPAAKGGLLSRVLMFTGEQTPEERDRIAAEEFQQAIEPVMEYMRAAVPEASSPEEAARILSENQGEITPDPNGGSYVHGDAFDADARVYYRLLRRDYEKNPRPSQKKQVSHHLHGIYGKLTGTKGW